MNSIIKIANDYSFLQSEDVELKAKLCSMLKFHIMNYRFHPKFQQKKWDGKIEFFSSRTGRFLTGLLPEIKLALRHLSVPYEVEDCRPKFEFFHKEIDSQFLNQWLPEGEKPITLEDYQVDFTNQAIKYKRGIIKSPTASGKTYILISILKALPPKTPILFLANRMSVVDQNWKEIIRWGFENVGRLDGENRNPDLITCSTSQSIHLIEKFLPNFKVLIVDEIHTMMSDVPITAYKKLVNCNVRIGLSATPFKYEGKDKVHKYNVKGYFGPVFPSNVTENKEISTKELQERGRLSTSRCVFYPVLEPKIPYHLYMDAVTEGIAENISFHNIVVKLVKSLKGRTLILVQRIAHGDILHSIMSDSIWVQGKDDQDTRDITIDLLKKADNAIAIATTGIFNTGINVFVHNLVNASGGKAEHEVIQRIGRGLRIANDKETLNYFDFLFKINPYLESHSKKRIQVLKKEQHEVIVKTHVDF